MPGSTRLNDTINTTKLLGALFEAYEEIAVMKMQRIRNGVLYTRDFLHEVGLVFRDTKEVYSKRVKGVRKTNIDAEHITPRNGKTVAIYISPKEKFSGNIGHNVFENFYDFLTANKAVDAIVIGATGKQLLRMKDPKYKFKYFDNKTVDGVEFETLVKTLLVYSQIKVFFGQFQNIVSQKPAMTDLSTGAISSGEKSTNNLSVGAIFEPSIQHVLYYFESQTTKALFKQCASESELARLGSQINAMEQANQNAKDMLKALKIQALREEKQSQNKKQLERLSGISLWRIE